MAHSPRYDVQIEEPNSKIELLSYIEIVVFEEAVHVSVCLSSASIVRPGKGELPEAELAKVRIPIARPGHVFPTLFDPGAADCQRLVVVQFDTDDAAEPYARKRIGVHEFDLSQKSAIVSAVRQRQTDLIVQLGILAVAQLMADEEVHLSALPVIVACV